MTAESRVRSGRGILVLHLGVNIRLASAIIQGAGLTKTRLHDGSSSCGRILFSAHPGRRVVVGGRVWFKGILVNIRLLMLLLLMLKMILGLIWLMLLQVMAVEVVLLSLLMLELKLGLKLGMDLVNVVRVLVGAQVGSQILLLLLVLLVLLLLQLLLLLELLELSFVSSQLLDKLAVSDQRVRTGASARTCRGGRLGHFGWAGARSQSRGWDLALAGGRAGLKSHGADLDLADSSGNLTDSTALDTGSGASDRADWRWFHTRPLGTGLLVPVGSNDRRLPGVASWSSLYGLVMALGRGSWC